MKRNNLSLLALALLVISCSTAQKATKTADILAYKNSITSSELSKHLYIVADDNMEGRNTGEPGQKRAGEYLISEYKKNGISFPTGATDFYQKVPSEFMKRGFAPKLNDSENIWAFIEGTEKPNEILVISAHYDHVGMKDGLPARKSLYFTRLVKDDPVFILVIANYLLIVILPHCGTKSNPNTWCVCTSPPSHGA